MTGKPGDYSSAGGGGAGFPGTSPGGTSFSGSPGFTVVGGTIGMPVRMGTIGGPIMPSGWAAYSDQVGNQMGQ